MDGIRQFLSPQGASEKFSSKVLIKTRSLFFYIILQKPSIVHSILIKNYHISINFLTHGKHQFLKFHSNNNLKQKSPTMSDEDDYDEQGDNENENDKEKLSKAKSISKMFEKWDSAPKYITWNLSYKANKLSKFKLSNKVAKQTDPWLKNSLLKWSLKDSPHKASFSFKPFDGKKQLQSASIGTSLDQFSIDLNLKGKRDISTKIKYSQKLVQNDVKFKLQLTPELKKQTFQQKWLASLSYKSAISHPMLFSQIFDSELSTDFSINSQREQTIKLQYLLNLPQKQNPLNSQDATYIDDKQGQEKLDNSKQNGRKGKDKNLLYKFFFNNKYSLKQKDNSLKVNFNTILEDCQTAQTYEIKTVMGPSSYLSVDLMHKWKYNKNNCLGLMLGYVRQLGKQKDKFEIIAEFNKVKYFGDINLSLGKYLGFSIKKKWNWNLTTDFLLQKGLSNNNCKYGFKVSVNV